MKNKLTTIEIIILTLVAVFTFNTFTSKGETVEESLKKIEVLRNGIQNDLRDAEINIKTLDKITESMQLKQKFSNGTTVVTKLQIPN
jgi:hypothetical protein